MCRIVAEDPGADQRMWIDVGMPQELAAMRDDLREISGRERRQRCGVGVDLIAEDPQMTTGQAPLFAAPQTQLASAVGIGAK